MTRRENELTRLFQGSSLQRVFRTGELRMLNDLEVANQRCCTQEAARFSVCGCKPNGIAAAGSIKHSPSRYFHRIGMW
jgi:hypothetical protein